MNLRDLIRDEPGRGRSDFTLLLADAGSFQATISRMADPWRERGVTKVAALDSMGFVFGGALARELGVGVVLLRKGGKEAWRAHAEQYRDFSEEEKTLILFQGALTPDDCVLLSDDWTETGAGLRAAKRLIEAGQATVVGAAVLYIDSEARFDGLEVHAALDEDPLGKD